MLTIAQRKEHHNMFDFIVVTVLVLACYLSIGILIGMLTRFGDK